MDESALKTLLDNLKMSQSSLHGWLHFWTFLVVLGVALEVVFVVWEYAEDLHDFRRGIVRPPDKPSILLLVLGLLGAGLVAVGVAGELYIDVHAGKVETEIRKANELRVSLLSKEAGDAKSSAEGAALAANRAKASADAAGIAADKAKEKVEAVAKRAEEIDADLAQTQWLMSARSVQNRDELTEKLKQQFKGRDIILASYTGDQEGWGLCTQLLYVARSAEMKPIDECGRFAPAVPLVSPLSISGPDIQETLDIADSLVKIGRITFGVASGFKAPTLTIFVGVKPPFMIGQARGVKTPPTKRQPKKKNAKP